VRERISIPGSTFPSNKAKIQPVVFLHLKSLCFEVPDRAIRAQSRFVSKPVRDMQQSNGLHNNNTVSGRGGGKSSQRKVEFVSGGKQMQEKDDVLDKW